MAGLHGLSLALWAAIRHGVEVAKHKGRWRVIPQTSSGGWLKDGESTRNIRAYQKETMNLSEVKNQKQNPTTPVISVTPSLSFNSNFYIISNFQRNIHPQASSFCMAHYIYNVFYIISRRQGNNITSV